MRLLAAIVVLGLAGACSPQPPPVATYEPPTTTEARNAFRQALAADSHATGTKVREFRESDVTAFGYQAGIANNKNRIENDESLRMLSTLNGFTVSDCAWQAFERGGMPSVTKQRVGKAPAAAYLCSYEAHYLISAHLGKRESTRTSGYFFKDDKGFVFAGRYRNPFD